MIHIVIGTKAQLIKMAPIMLELQNRDIDYNFIFTGQHQETMHDLRENFSLKMPDVVLYRGKDIVSVPTMFFWIVRILYLTITKRRHIFGSSGAAESVVVVHGDTFSTLLGAIMGKLAGIKVAHVESGLRSFRLFHPFPEEMTRILTFALSDIYFCPGRWALDNLKKFRGEKINTEYNTLLDSLRHAVDSYVNFTTTIPLQPYCIATTHRFENLYSKAALEKTIALVEEAAKIMKTIFVMHPITESKLRAFDLLERLQSNPNVELRPRMDYFNFVRLIKKSEFVMTDGGSNQEECFFMGKPCLLLRKATERMDGLGHNVTISNFEIEKVRHFLHTYPEYVKSSKLDDAFPSAKIAESLKKFAVGSRVLASGVGNYFA